MRGWVSRLSRVVGAVLWQLVSVCGYGLAAKPIYNFLNIAYTAFLPAIPVSIVYLTRYINSMLRILMLGDITVSKLAQETRKTAQYYNPESHHSEFANRRPTGPGSLVTTVS